ncbi:SIMPL domain-containing protein [Flavobacterium urocaniciphilum]|uniref:SIMPL domain-containing protein n=1 Tax=Flavobacterium urocaniciphilum TaxID=1299341 RepID=A0A1H9BJV7_9FLAO|nr:SIMPL domain-containing protein [Flavobacterium urocaniciphilum]SEP89185.1 hypothetical protein SAMN05444005_10357 [Flavobacterium urocaniciphilum]
MKKTIYYFTIFALFSIGFGFSQQKSTIRVNGLGKVTAFPNAAIITLELDHVKPTLREAVNENQKTLSLVKTLIKNYVKDTTQIKTSLISTNKISKWDSKLAKEVFVGFESSQKIIFTLLDLNQMQNFTEELLKTKFNKIQSIAYFNTNSEELMKQAQDLAVKDAIEITKRLAKSANVEISSIVNISTNNSANEERFSTERNEFETYGKAMGGRGVSSSGQLIEYVVRVSMETEIFQ